MPKQAPNKLTVKGVNAIHQENAAGWEVVGRTKYRNELGRVLEGLKKGECPLPKHQLVHLQPLCSGCHRVIHLCCANGQDALALLALGAEEAVGVDISKEMIALAQELTDALDVPASWYCCDVLETPHELDGTADLVYTGGGALPWVMDIDAWAAVIYRLLQPGGTLFLDEFHPLNYSWESEATDYKLAPGPNYCDGGIAVNNGYPTTRVAMHTDIEDRPNIRERIWPLGDVINAVIRTGLVLKHFQEISDPGWSPFGNMPPEILHRLPHGYTLIAGKPGPAK